MVVGLRVAQIGGRPRRAVAAVINSLDGAGSKGGREREFSSEEEEEEEEEPSLNQRKVHVSHHPAL